VVVVVPLWRQTIGAFWSGHYAVRLGCDICSVFAFAWRRIAAALVCVVLVLFLVFVRQ